jgi:hypothetical protein
LHRGIDKRFGDRREWRFYEAKQKREVAMAGSGVKEWTSHIAKWSYEEASNKKVYGNRWGTFQKTPAMIREEWKALDAEMQRREEILKTAMNNLQCIQRERVTCE